MSSSPISAPDSAKIERLMGGILPLIVVADGAWRLLGTAFVVKTNGERDFALLLTATHVVDELRSIDGPSSRVDSSLSHLFLKSRDHTLSRAHSYVLLNEAGRVTAAPVTQYWYDDAHDVAICEAAVPTGLAGRFQVKFSLDSAPVDVGTPVAVAGYSRGKSEDVTEGETDGTTWSALPRLSFYAPAGGVTEVHRNGIRPKGYPGHGPGFVVSPPIHSGMSGSPIFDIREPHLYVRGVASSDLSLVLGEDSRGSGALSFGSMIWIAMSMRIDRQFYDKSKNPLPKPAQFLDLIRAGIIDDRGRADLHVVRMWDIDGSESVYWLPTLDTPISEAKGVDRAPIDSDNN